MMSTKCSKHVEAWNKLTVKQNKKNCASSWLITEMHGQQNIKIYQLHVSAIAGVATFRLDTIFFFIREAIQIWYDTETN